MSKKNNQRTKSKKSGIGFTLIEVVVYIAVIGIVGGMITSFIVWGIRINNELKVKEEILSNASQAMEAMIYEIKEAKNIIVPISHFDNHPGQLCLETIEDILPGEETAYVDFYIDNDDRLCLKRENQIPASLTSGKVRVTNLVFTNFTSLNSFPSIQINLTIEYKDSFGGSEYKKSISLTSTATPRSY